ncbi:hypothetical protein L7F22_013445 [Adiantum nelumboides]|nr:hypothetical protein [Adiantum nelumboides]
MKFKNVSALLYAFKERLSKVENNYALKEEKIDTMKRDVSEMMDVSKSWTDVCNGNVVFGSPIMQAMAHTKIVKNVDAQELRKWKRHSKNIVICGIVEENLETPPSLAIANEGFFNTHFGMSKVMVYGAHRVGKQGSSCLGERPIVCTMVDETKQKIILDNSWCLIKCGSRKSFSTPTLAVIANGPFEKWGIDAMGPLPRTANGKLYILVAVDYMTRFGTPLEIVFDNGPGFRRGIIRKMVESKPKCWDNFLDGAIWAYITTYRDATQFTPFHLVYGQEALQPIELNIPTMKLTGRQEQSNDEAWIDRLLNLVELEWKREAAYHCYEKKALQLKDKLNEGIKDKEIKEKSLVLRYNNALDNRFDAKFERRWEGPFIVKKAFTGGYYQLMDLNSKEHPRKVNGYRLKPYLSRILPAVFETKQVSKKTKKVCCHCCSGTHQVKSCAFQHVLHEAAKDQKEKLSSPTSCPESSFQYDPVDGT